MSVIVSKQKILRCLLLPLCFFLALGEVAYSDSNLSTLHILIAIFVLVYISFNLNAISHFLKNKSILIVILTLTLALSELMGPVGFYNANVINLKLIISIFFFYSLASYLKKHPEDFNYILSAFITGIIVLTAMVFLGSDIATTYKGKIVIADENPNSTGARLAVGGLMLSYFILNQKKYNIWILTIQTALLCVITYLTLMGGSRGALGLLFFGFGFMVFFSKLSRKTKTLSLALLIYLLFLVIGYLTSIEGQIGEKWAAAMDGDTAGRTDLWEVALTLFIDNPLFGVGESGFFNLMMNHFGSFKDAHNVFIYLLAAGGIASFGLYSIFLFFLCKQAYDAKAWDNGLRITLLIGAILLAVKSGGALTYLLLWFLYALIDGIPARNVK